MTTIATAAMINNKVTTNDWFLGFTVPPKDNSSEDYTNMSIVGIAHLKILYISLINPFVDLDAESDPALTRETALRGRDPNPGPLHGSSHPALGEAWPARSGNNRGAIRRDVHAPPSDMSTRCIGRAPGTGDGRHRRSRDRGIAAPKRAPRAGTRTSGHFVWRS